MVDALVDRTDEGRDGLRYASGSCRVGFDPRISEWGDPATVMGGHHSFVGVRREVKHLSTCRKGYSVSSGERKRIRLNRVRVITVRCCVFGVVGLTVQPLTGLRRVIKHRVM